eukprot:Filipodium_phascolosomae@DN3913_c0_g1_i1.p1
MGIAENPNKIRNLVEGQICHLAQIYGKMFFQNDLFGWKVVFLSPEVERLLANAVEADQSDSSVACADDELLLKNTENQLLSDSARIQIIIRDQDYPIIFAQLPEAVRVQTQGKTPQHLQKALVQLVQRSAWAQSLKGVFTAGPFRSLQYANSKLLKRMKG